MHRGYIKLWRRIQETNMWLGEKFTRGQAWVDLLMLANHKDGYVRKRGIRVDLKRGDVGWSERELAERWKWSRDKVRRFLSELCSDNEEKLQPQTRPQNKNVTSCYSVINYNLYQDSKTTDLATNRPQTDRKQDQNKNDKNENKIKYPPNFEKFYAAYPRKKEKKKAFNAWKKHNPPLDACLKAIETQKREREKLLSCGTFCPDWKYPATWLNGGCWEDEPIKVKPKQKNWRDTF